MVILHKLPLKPIENRKDLVGFSSVGETVEIDQFFICNDVVRECVPAASIRKAKEMKTK